MKKHVLTLVVGLVLAIIAFQPAQAQNRYVDDIFAEVIRTDTVPYGQNISILTGAPDTIPLICDIYEPVGDTASERYVVLIASTGNFLPKLFNGGPFGTIKDSSTVELATRLAKKGYVAVPFYYRQGWDATNPDVTTQTQTLLQATYRGIQDAKTCARWFRMTQAENGNPYRINKDAIGIMGIGTGGYLAYAANFLNDLDTELNLIKFQDPTTGDILVDTTVQGNLDGTVAAPLNIANHVGYSSDFQIAINIGGACGDSSWVNAGESPTISFHCSADPFAPYFLGNVIVPTTGNVVIDNAAGSRLISRIQDRLGNNDIFKDAGFSDDFTTEANTKNDGWEGFFPFILPDTGGTYDCGPGTGTQLPLTPQSSPWYWWDEATFIAEWNGGGFDAATGVPGVIANCDQRANNPDMSKAKALTYIDTLMGYMAPRLNLAFAVSDSVGASTKDLISQNIKLYPNPATDLITLTNSDGSDPIREVSIMDKQGRIIYRRQMNQSGAVKIRRENWSSGLYLLRIETRRGVATKKLLLN